MEKMSMPMAYAMKKKSSGRHMCEGGGCEHSSHFAEGGKVDDSLEAQIKTRDREASGGSSHYGIGTTENFHPKGKNTPIGKMQREKSVEELRRKPKPELYAEGGSVEDEGESIHPMVKRIMMGRAEGYSEGGHVANEGEDELDEMADGKPNEFDDEVLDDHLEGHNSGADEGDELGDEEEEHDRHDIVARIMKSRSKKDRMPRPA